MSLVIAKTRFINPNPYLDFQDADERKVEKREIMTKKIKCSRVSGTNLVQARQRMLARKVAKRMSQKDEAKDAKSTSYKLREFKKGGKKHYILVKKQETCQPPVEEIFTEWKENLETVHRKPRVRKLSHRAQRKALLKEVAALTSTSTTVKQPLLYADVVKKNLNLAGINSMEDIFEAWRDYLQEVDDVLKDDLSLPSSPEPVQTRHVEAAVEKIKNSVMEMKRKQAHKKDIGNLEQVKGCS